MYAIGDHETHGQGYVSCEIYPCRPTGHCCKEHRGDGRDCHDGDKSSLGGAIDLGIGVAVPSRQLSHNPWRDRQPQRLRNGSVARSEIIGFQPRGRYQHSEVPSVSLREDEARDHGSSPGAHEPSPVSRVRPDVLGHRCKFRRDEDRYEQNRRRHDDRHAERPKAPTRPKGESAEQANHCTIRTQNYRSTEQSSTEHEERAQGEKHRPEYTAQRCCAPHSSDHSERGGVASLGRILHKKNAQPQHSRQNRPNHRHPSCAHRCLPRRPHRVDRSEKIGLSSQIQRARDRHERTKRDPDAIAIGSKVSNGNDRQDQQR
ncbi:MAG: hypothetical protein JWM34_4655 [Ilumatobacteraceae bacterium]|nr:hypothetical protein [Ilumatobacteraceae bacterium]